MNFSKVYPLSWFHDKKNDELICKAVIISHGRRFIRVRLGSTKILTSVDEIDANEIKDIMDEYNASKVMLSNVSKTTLILRNPIMESNANWVSVETDPQGLISSFFQIKDINPYEPFLIKEYKDNDEEINERNILKTDIKERAILRKLYWDLEIVTSRKEFVYAQYIDNPIIYVSFVLDDGDTKTPYFLHWGSYDIQNKDFISVRFSREKDMLEYFFNIIEEFDPDRMYTFNGDSFDIPYLIQRCEINGIIPKNIKFVNKRIKGRFEWETVKAFNTPGIEHFDILRIMLRFYPGLPNYRLETIGRLFIGEGKTGLGIEEMFRSFYIQESEGMEASAKYSVKDSLLLATLNEKLNFDNVLESVANSCGMINNEILDTYDYTLVDKCAYRTDPGSINMSGLVLKDKVLSEIKQNTLYKNIYSYDYSGYYTLEMQRYENQFNYDLSLRTLDLPSKVKSQLYYSKYFHREPDNLIEQLINSSNNIIEVTDVSIKSIGQLEDLFPGTLIEMKKYTHYLQLGKASYTAKDIEGNIIKVGTVKVLKPSFKMAQDYLIRVLEYIFEISNERPEYDVKNANLEDYVIETKLKDIEEYPLATDKYILAVQFNQRIKTWTRVKYYMTVKGPILKELYNNEELDLNYYDKELKNIKKLLKYRK